MARSRVKLLTVINSSSFRTWPHQSKHLTYPSLHYAASVKTAGNNSAWENMVEGDKRGYAFHNCPVELHQRYCKRTLIHRREDGQFIKNWASA